MTDRLRVLTVRADATRAAEEAVVDVELCPDARVYGIDLRLISGEATPEAELRLQDSTLVARSTTLPVRFDLPGIHWPAFAKLVASAGAVAELHVAYGNCDP